MTVPRVPAISDDAANANQGGRNNEKVRTEGDCFGSYRLDGGN